MKVLLFLFPFALIKSLVDFICEVQEREKKKKKAVRIYIFEKYYTFNFLSYLLTCKKMLFF